MIDSWWRLEQRWKDGEKQHSHGSLVESFLTLLGTQPKAVHMLFLALEHYYLSETRKFKSDWIFSLQEKMDQRWLN